MTRSAFPKRTLLVVIAGGWLASQAVADGESRRYRNDAQFREAVAALQALGGPVAQASVLAKTAGGREVSLIQLASPGATPVDQRRALLLVGGIDADLPATAEVALDVASELVRLAQADPDSPAGKLLADCVVYVVPRLNPDGVERYFEVPPRRSMLNGRAVDDDRDGLVNEDGPEDLDGDGAISVMRVMEAGGEWIVDPDHPRLMRRADAAKDEVGLYRVMLEGRDDDNDGQMNEDGPGGVNPNRNWPHFYESGEVGVGQHQLSEPETRALAQFVVDHPRIAAVFVYGRHDTVVAPPKGEQRDAAGVAYRDLHPDDTQLYARISERYQEITGRKRAGTADPRGAFYAWTYSHRGIPTFAMRVWTPEPDAKEKAPDGEHESPAAADGAVSETPDTGEKSVEADAKPVPKRKDKAEKDAPETDPVAARVISSEDNRAERDGEPIAPEWRAFDHPTLGRVELGGVAPFATTTPPAEALDAIAARETAFLLDIAARLPRLAFRDIKSKPVGPGVWEIELSLVNEGYLPTRIGAARLAERPPTIVRPDVPAERILAGRRFERVPTLAGSGGAVKLRWLITGGDGETVTFIAGSGLDVEARVEIKLANGKEAGQ